MDFKLVSKFQPTGDQSRAIDQLVEGLNREDKKQALLGVTGSEKTFTVVNVIVRVNRLMLVLAHNKTSATQLCPEFREFSPENSVEYSVSYYNYCQLEAYIPTIGTYIEKSPTINDEIDKLRYSTTAALSERRDMTTVMSASCTYSLGNSVGYHTTVISLHPGMQTKRDGLLKKLVELQYKRNNVNSVHNKLRIYGDMVEVSLAQSSRNAIRVEFFGDKTERISEISALMNELKAFLKHMTILLTSHYTVPREKMMIAVQQSEQEMQEWVKLSEPGDKLIEAQRICERTMYDVEVLQEIGLYKEIENYPRALFEREPGSAPLTLFDYFPEDFLPFADGSHVSLPRARSMYAGDRARKEALINFDFRLSPAYDNRPLNSDEFYECVSQAVFASVIPGDLELQKSA